MLPCSQEGVPAAVGVVTLTTPPQSLSRSQEGVPAAVGVVTAGIGSIENAVSPKRVCPPRWAL